MDGGFAVRKAAGVVDLTRGSILRATLLFALPLCIGSILQQMYSFVDTLIIGRCCEESALAAVGTSYQPIEILMCVFFGFGTATSILISQAVGKKDPDKIRHVIENTTGFMYRCTVPLTVFGILVAPLLLRLMQVPDDAFPDALTYIRILLLGTIANMGSNTNAGILRGLGDSTSSLIFLVCTCIVNAVLDLLFVAVLHMGVAGAAVATLIAVWLEWLLTVIYIRMRHPELNYSPMCFRVEKETLRSIVRIGLPIGLNMSIYAIGHAVLQLLVNAQGSTFMAACVIGDKVNGIANISIGAFASAATTFAGQNSGA